MIYKKIDDIKVQKVDANNDGEKSNLINDLQNYMDDFADPLQEVGEAVNSASKTGFIIEATNGKNRLGLAVVTRSPFDHFQPKYHLAYIATSPQARGKGIGRILLETVMELTDNSVALHVGIANKNAISFYKNMGWKSSYLRMVPEPAA
ncbi:MAG TPA: GNAT family N-acetyltransferase [bacterium]|nr:GNAT family N-acetyltransferase [bacterium]